MKCLRICKRAVFCGAFFAMMIVATPQSVSGNPLAGRAASMLTDQVMRGLQSGIADLAAKAPVPEELKPEVEQKLTEAARRIVQQHVQGAMGGRLPNPASLVQQVLGELRNVVSDVVNAALSTSGGVAQTAPSQQGVIVHTGHPQTGQPQNVGAENFAAGGVHHVGQPQNVGANVHHQQPAARTAPPSVSIVPLSLMGTAAGDNADMRTLVQILQIAIANTGVYNVLPPRAAVVRAVVEELETQRPGHTNEDKAKAIGAAVNADNVLLAETRTLGNLNMLVLQIYNASDGSLIAGEIINYREIEDAAEQIPQVAERLTANVLRPAPVVQHHQQPQPSHQQHLQQQQQVQHPQMVLVPADGMGTPQNPQPVYVVVTRPQRPPRERKPPPEPRRGTVVGYRLAYNLSEADVYIHSPNLSGSYYGYDSHNNAGHGVELGLALSNAFARLWSFRYGVNFISRNPVNAYSYRGDGYLRVREFAVAAPAMIRFGGNHPAFQVFTESGVTLDFAFADVRGRNFFDVGYTFGGGFYIGRHVEISNRYTLGLLDYTSGQGGRLWQYSIGITITPGGR